MAHISSSTALETINEMIDLGPFPIRFPSESSLEQDQEWCEVFVEGTWRRIRFHDYAEIFEVPGLYETIYYRTLRCVSPTQVTGLLGDVLRDRGQRADELRALDFGAGNGMVGEALHNLGVRSIIGIDILEQAKRAAARDRPWVYNEYYVCDLTKLASKERSVLQSSRFNLLTVVAALGFGDIPPAAFLGAFELLEPGGWLAFNIKEDFLTSKDQHGFLGVLKKMVEKGAIRIELYRRYQHRLSLTAQPLYYGAIIAQKAGG